MEHLVANDIVDLTLRVRIRLAERDVYLGEANRVTSNAPQSWYVMLRDEAAGGKITVPLKPFLHFSERMDRQLSRLQRQAYKQIPQLKRRGTMTGRSRRSSQEASGG